MICEQKMSVDVSIISQRLRRIKSLCTASHHDDHRSRFPVSSDYIIEAPVNGYVHDDIAHQILFI